jgi:hypothetical protein
MAWANAPTLDGETFSNPDFEDVRIPMHFRNSPRYEGAPVIAITLPAR